MCEYTIEMTNMQKEREYAQEETTEEMHKEEEAKELFWPPRA